MYRMFPVARCNFSSCLARQSDKAVIRHHSLATMSKARASEITGEEGDLYKTFAVATSAVFHRHIASGSKQFISGGYMNISFF